MSPGPDGGAMSPVTGYTATFSGGNTAVTIETPTGTDIDAVFFSATGQGTRCLYTFSDYTEKGLLLTRGGEAFQASSITVCSDGLGTAPPQEPEVIEPISTVGDGCEGLIEVDGDPVGDWAVVSAISQDGTSAAVCSAPGTEQAQCINTCENFEARAETAACANASAGLEFGQLDLEACRPCDLTNLQSPPARDVNGDPLFYCWEYAGSVVRNPALNQTYPTPGTEFVPGTTIPRTRGTLLPHKDAWSISEEVRAYNACTTKTTFVNGRQYTYTTCK
jgi:hypothetical protein